MWPNLQEAADLVTIIEEIHNGKLKFLCGVCTVLGRLGWPAGTYGLPEAVSGCPNFEETTWTRGYTYHNTEDINPANKRSQNYHFAGNFSQHGIQQRFCIKEKPDGSNDFWPEGKYCIYKKGNEILICISIYIKKTGIMQVTWSHCCCIGCNWTIASSYFLDLCK